MAEPDEHFNLGMMLLKRRDLHAAISLAQDGLQSFPDDGDLWELLGVSQYHAGDHAAARDSLEHASAIQPLDLGARYCLAGAYERTGLRDVAVFVYRLIADDERAPTCLLPKIATRLGQMTEYSAALDVCRIIVGREPNHHGAHFGIAFYLRKLGDPMEQVAPQLARAHELAPEVALYRVALASLLQELGDTEAACDLLRDVSLDSLGCTCLLKRMALFFRLAGETQRAQDCARRLRQLDPNDDLPLEETE
jgi:Flp pilus assembly protein TadD